MNFQFKQYLTVKNIVMAVMAIAIIFLLITVFKKSPEVVDNSATTEILKNQVTTLEKQLKELEKQYAEKSKKDSIQIANLQMTTTEDTKIIYIYKTKADEKSDHIDTTGNSDIRNILAEK